eukprot:Seg2410.5 transcript_id=Seg2410.5/GoldUCD/mRNA.D3Y31 product="Transient receptor potential cation channel subfamily M member 6" protein_id=Seg2410.5/GoldUCD/D3Y31
MANGMERNKGKKLERENGKVKKKTEKPAPANSSEGKHLTIQRLSPNVCGKAQKYARLGPREFVPYPSSKDLTVQGIKDACKMHFRPKGNQEVDVLAGEQEPSCHTLEQIPNIKLIHIRFLDRPGSYRNMFSLKGDDDNDSDGDDDILSKSPFAKSNKKRKLTSAGTSCFSVPSNSTWPTKPTATPRKIFPKSISVSEMLNLGKVVMQTDVKETVEVYKFDMENTYWTVIPEIVDFPLAKSHFSEGGFRKAFKATSPTIGYSGTWVIKRYKQETLETITKLLGQTVEEHTKKVIQMHSLARNFCQQLSKRVTEVCPVEFGKVPSYGDIFLGKIQDEVVSIEQYVSGDFVKYINNTGKVDQSLDEVGEKMECLAHYSYEKSEKQLMLLDIQGSCYNLYDPEIASSVQRKDGEFLFGAESFMSVATKMFVKLYPLAPSHLSYT